MVLFVVFRIHPFVKVLVIVFIVVLYVNYVRWAVTHDCYL